MKNKLIFNSSLMNKENQQKATIWFLTAFRIFIGWHFLFEGISKLLNPNWSSSAYLMQSQWLFSGFFHWLISNTVSLHIVDFLNIWGLIIIGLCLFIGFFTRTASISGALLLLLYYIANPPFIHSSAPSEGHFYIINYNLIEASALIVFASFQKDYLWGIQRLIANHAKLKAKKFPQKDNQEIQETFTNSRRELIKNLAVLPFLGVVFFGMAKKRGWISFEENNLANKTDGITSASMMVAKGHNISELKGKMPMGKIKHVELSRIIPGGNLISGYAHSRDLIYVSPLIKNYFHDEKIIETLWLYEASGMNTTIMRTDNDTIRVLKEFWRRGGKIQWLAQTYPEGNDLSNIQMSIDNGAIGAFVMGGIADKNIYDNKLEDLAKPIEFIRSKGLIGGTAAHSIKVPQACIDNRIETDFFMKTFHRDNYWSATPMGNRGIFSELQEPSPDHNFNHDNMWCISSDETADFFKKCEVPWIAYKVLAAGAIKPEDGLNFAYEKGADFACMGMFDFQVIENANLVYNIFQSDLKRERKWFA